MKLNNRNVKDKSLIKNRVSKLVTYEFDEFYKQIYKNFELNKFLCVIVPFDGVSLIVKIDNLTSQKPIEFNLFGVIGPKWLSPFDIFVSNIAIHDYKVAFHEALIARSYENDKVCERSIIEYIFHFSTLENLCASVTRYFLAEKIVSI